MFRKLLCTLGFHLVARKDTWTPSISAKIVTEFEQKFTCTKCKKIVHHTHLRWNGDEMIERKNESH